MYSQNDEEAVVGKFFEGFTGRFLDVGAYDGIQMSNTRRLLEIGWEGVLVEPMWTNFQKLCDNCILYLNKVKLIAAAVAGKSGIRKLWVDLYPDRTWSTTINRQLMESGSIMKASSLDTFVPCVTMQDLSQFGPFDFISLDAEWEDFEILKSTPVGVWNGTRLICIESRNLEERQQMLKCFNSIGFDFHYETKENLIVCRV